MEVASGGKYSPLDTHTEVNNGIQLFREGLSVKVHATIWKGIVDGFDFTFVQRNLKQGHERAWRYVCEC